MLLLKLQKAHRTFHETSRHVSVTIGVAKTKCLRVNVNLNTLTPYSSRNVGFSEMVNDSLVIMRRNIALS